MKADANLIIDGGYSFHLCDAHCIEQQIKARQVGHKVKIEKYEGPEECEICMKETV